MSRLQDPALAKRSWLLGENTAAWLLFDRGWFHLAWVNGRTTHPLSSSGAQQLPSPSVIPDSPVLWSCLVWDQVIIPRPKNSCVPASGTWQKLRACSMKSSNWKAKTDGEMVEFFRRGKKVILEEKQNEACNDQKSYHTPGNSTTIGKLSEFCSLNSLKLHTGDLNFLWRSHFPLADRSHLDSV